MYFDMRNSGVEKYWKVVIMWCWLYMAMRRNFDDEGRIYENGEYVCIDTKPPQKDVKLASIFCYPNIRQQTPVHGPSHLCLNFMRIRHKHPPTHLYHVIAVSCTLHHTRIFNVYLPYKKASCSLLLLAS